MSAITALWRWANRPKSSKPSGIIKNTSNTFPEEEKSSCSIAVGTLALWWNGFFGFCTEREYKDFMRGVDGFEKDLVRQGTFLIKLYFSVTQEVQAERFERRRSDPLRQWKLSAVDLQAQDRWDDFTDVKYDMLKHTNTTIAPWTVIRSIDKHRAHLSTVKVILNTVPYERLNQALDFVPDPKIVVSGARELELMEAERLRRQKKSSPTDCLRG